jgi:hypothetical protein
MLPVYRACLSWTSKVNIAPSPVLAAIVLSCARDPGLMARVCVEEAASHRDKSNGDNPRGADAGDSPDHDRSTAPSGQPTGGLPRRREPS